MIAGRGKVRARGAPAWIVTFADLMSLLVCFFVLIISFSVQDEKKMQVVAGSLRIAFGVQKDFQARGVVEIDGRPERRHLQLQPTDNTVIVMPLPEASPPQEVEIEESEQTEADWDQVDPLGETDSPPSSIAETFSDFSDARAEYDMARLPPEEQIMIAPPTAATARGDWGIDFKDAMLDALEKRVVEDLQRELEILMSTDEDLAALHEHVRIERTDEGVKLRVLDQPNVSMFARGSDRLNMEAEQLVPALADLLAEVPNRIEILGHTDAVPYSGGSTYDNWNLSSDRAHAMRRALVDAGVDESRIKRVTGRADTDPLVAGAPSDDRNRRIEVLLLRGDT